VIDHYKLKCVDCEHYKNGKRRKYPNETKGSRRWVECGYGLVNDRSVACPNFIKGE